MAETPDGPYAAEKERFRRDWRIARAIYATIVVIFLGVIVGLCTAAEKTNKREAEACVAAGGVPHLPARSPVLCLKRDAIITVERS